jgi:hypothetical protein
VPSGSDLPFRPDGGRGARTESTGDELVSILEGSLRTGASARWQELVAGERVVEEVAAEFDGEDPPFAAVGDILRNVRARLEELFHEMNERLGGLDLGEPGEEMLNELRKSLRLPSPS